MMLSLGLLLLTLAPAPALQDAATDASAPSPPEDWLVLEAIDGRGRRPFRPDGVLQEYVVKGRAPKAGESLGGERGTHAWNAVEADDRGRVRGSIGYAYAGVELDEPAVVLAKLTGASTLIVNGRAVAGDLYGYGWGGLPVALEAGANDVFVTGVRGGFKLAFEMPPADTPLAPAAFRHTLPQLVVGEPVEGELGLCVRNASRDWLPSVAVEIRGARWAPDDEAGDPGEPLDVLRSTFVFEEGLAPLAVRNLAVRLASASPRAVLGRAGAIELDLAFTAPGVAPAHETIRLAVRDAGARRNRTYRSDVDGSVQLYTVVPPSRPDDDADDEARDMGLVLTLHGASVFAPSQARSYAAKPDFWIVAPTNRSNYGFDWQDWGRRDAYDVLAAALAESGVDRRRVYLTGHSMGGHGTWHLGANDPDGFAAIAPSAGWQSFDTYGGRPEGELKELWHRADAPSRTAELAGNLAQLPTFVLHGDADDNVRVDEARAMIELVTAAGGAPESHFEEGKGHWWDGPAGGGADCVDWPGIFDLFRKSEIPRDPTELDFTTVDPGTDSTHHWVRVLQQSEPGEPSRVRAVRSKERVSLSTDNVRMLALLPPASDASAFEIDGALLEASSLKHGARFVRTDGAWRPAGEADPSGKSPERMGPLKRGFDRRFVLVVPTGGEPGENAASLERATFDAGTWWYRGNGDAPIVRDVDWLARSAAYRGRNPVLYGNLDTNRAWRSVFDGAPIVVRRGAAFRRVPGEHQERAYPGDAIDALFVVPFDDEGDAGDDRADHEGGGLAVALASTGPAADRRSSALALFVSGVGYPDFAIVGPDVLAGGDGGVLDAGFFDHAWR